MAKEDGKKTSSDRAIHIQVLFTMAIRCQQSGRENIKNHHVKDNFMYCKFLQVTLKQMYGNP